MNIAAELLCDKTFYSRPEITAQKLIEISVLKLMKLSRVIFWGRFTPHGSLIDIHEVIKGYFKGRFTPHGSLIDIQPPPSRGCTLPVLVTYTVSNMMKLKKDF